MPDDGEKEILIPEVLPPEGSEQRFERRARGVPPPPPEKVSTTDRMANVLAPVFTGLMLDIFSLSLSRLPGLIFCVPFGFWFGRVCGMRLKHCFLAAILAGYYGMLTIPRFTPIATLIGVFFAFRNASLRRTS